MLAALRAGGPRPLAARPNSELILMHYRTTRVRYTTTAQAAGHHPAPPQPGVRA